MIDTAYTHHVWVHYTDPVGSRDHRCALLEELPDGWARIRLAPEAPEVCGHLGAEARGAWPGPGLLTGFGGGDREVVVPAALVYTAAGQPIRPWRRNWTRRIIDRLRRAAA